MLAEGLVAVSMALALWQDVRVRSVHDATWIPAAAGLLLFLYLQPDLIPHLIPRLAFLGAAAFLASRLGAVGEADAICITFLAVDEGLLTPIPQLGLGGFVAGVHLLYLYLKGMAGRRFTISLPQFLREQRWIPRAVVEGGERRELGRDVNKARDEMEALAQGSPRDSLMVEVEYGVPLAAYLATGYLLTSLLRFTEKVGISLIG